MIMHSRDSDQSSQNYVLYYFITCCHIHSMSPRHFSRFSRWINGLKNSLRLEFSNTLKGPSAESLALELEVKLTVFQKEQKISSTVQTGIWQVLFQCHALEQNITTFFYLFLAR